MEALDRTGWYVRMVMHHRNPNKFFFLRSKFTITKTLCRGVGYPPLLSTAINVVFAGVGIKNISWDGS